MGARNPSAVIIVLAHFGLLFSSVHSSLPVTRTVGPSVAVTSLPSSALLTPTPPPSLRSDESTSTGLFSFQSSTCSTTLPLASVIFSWLRLAIIGPVTFQNNATSAFGTGLFSASSAFTVTLNVAAKTPEAPVVNHNATRIHRLPITTRSCARALQLQYCSFALLTAASEIA